MYVPSATCVAWLGTFKHGIASLASSADGAVLALAPHKSQIIELWDIPTETRLNTITLPDLPPPDDQNNKHESEAEEIISLALTDDGLFVAASLWPSGSIFVWTFTGELVFSLPGGSSFGRSVCFIPKTTYLTIITRETQLRIWDVATGQIVSVLPGIDTMKPSLLDKLGDYYHIVCAPGGWQIALNATPTGNMICLWDIQREQTGITCTKQTRFTWGEEVDLRVMKYEPGVSLLYHITGVAIEAYNTRACQLYSTMIQAGTFSATHYGRKTEQKYTEMAPTHVCFSSDGSMLFSSDYNGLISVSGLRNDDSITFDTVRHKRSGNYAAPPLFPEKAVQHITWLAQSRLLATAGRKSIKNPDTTVKLWYVE